MAGEKLAYSPFPSGGRRLLNRLRVGRIERLLSKTFGVSWTEVAAMIFMIAAEVVHFQAHVNVPSTVLFFWFLLDKAETAMSVDGRTFR